MKAFLASLIILAVLLSGLAAYLFIENTKLQRELQDLKSKYDGLTSKYNELRLNYEDLSKKYSDLHEEYSALKADYEKLSTMYQDLRKQYDLFLTGYAKLRKEVLERTFLDPEGWPSKIDYKDPEVFSATAKALDVWWYGVSPYSRIYGWVKDNIKYNYDTPLLILPNNSWEEAPWFADYWKKASETLEDGYGDCEDQAILVAAMVLNYWLIKYNTTYAIWVVLITGPAAAHAFTIIPIQGGKIIILDPAGSQITGLDLWIYKIVEPKDIYEAITNYIREWREQGYYFDKVYAVFNHKEYKILNMNIYEFIKWLYEQTK